jgi:hypothetical protein
MLGRGFGLGIWRLMILVLITLLDWGGSIAFTSVTIIRGSLEVGFGNFIYTGVRMDDLTTCSTRASSLHMNERRQLDLVPGAQSTQTDQCIVLGPQI